jgi:hypothetical protein
MQFGKWTACYAGSSRVWRAGESGNRLALIVDTSSAPIITNKKVIRSAGQYRILQLYAAPDNSIKIVNQKELSTWSDNDYVDCTINGVIEDETEISARLENLKKEYAHSYRRFELPKDKSQVYVLSGISENQLAKQFIKKWEASRAGYIEDDDVYNMARLKALVTLKNIIEGRN